MKESKQTYYTKSFENNWSNIESTWKGIKTVANSIKNIDTTICLTQLNLTTEPLPIPYSND